MSIHSQVNTLRLDLSQRQLAIWNMFERNVMVGLSFTYCKTFFFVSHQSSLVVVYHLENRHVTGIG